MTRRSWFPLLAGLLVACAPEIAPEGGDDKVLGDGEELTDGGAVRVNIDATSEEDWIGYSFADGILGAGTPGDIELQRYKIRLGSGVEAALVEGTFDSVSAPPSDGWGTDADPIVEDTDYVFNDWYVYDYENHSLAADEVVFVLRDGGGLSVKLYVEGYYDDAGTPGYMQFLWAEL